jgi:hypothetical protein
VEGFAVKQGAAEDVAEVGDLGEKTIQLWGQLCHLDGWINAPSTWMVP